MNFKKLLLPIVLLLSLSVGCSKETIEIEKVDDINETRTVVVRNFNTIKEAEEFRAQQTNLLSKGIEMNMKSSAIPVRSKSGSGGSAKTMLAQSTYQFFMYGEGWHKYNFEFESLKNYFPHLLEFNVHLSGASNPVLGAIILTAGSEILSGNQTILTPNFNTVNGSSTQFTASLNYIYEEKLVVASVVVYHTVYRTVVTVSRGVSAEMVIAHIIYTKIN